MSSTATLSPRARACARSSCSAACTSGCTMASSLFNAAGSSRTRPANRLRSTLPREVAPGNAASIAAAASPSYSRCTTASASCTGTPCSANRRAVVDFPIPTEPVSPMMNMVPRAGAGGKSFHQYTFPTKKLQQRQEWEPKDDEMVALNAFEELDSGPLQLITAHARRRRTSDSIEVCFEKGFAEAAHGEPRHFAMLEQKTAVTRDRNCRVQLVRPLPQQEKLLAGARSIPRF